MMFARVIATEFLKLRRARVTWFSLAALSLGPLAIALFMWIVREPGRAGKLGLLPATDGRGDVGRQVAGHEEASLGSGGAAVALVSVAAAAHEPAQRRSRCSALTTLQALTVGRSPGNSCRRTTVPFGPAQPTKTSPTGLSGVAPPGPATPVTLTP